jgi:hypothetical protein
LPKSARTAELTKLRVIAKRSPGCGARQFSTRRDGFAIKVSSWRVRNLRLHFIDELSYTGGETSQGRPLAYSAAGLFLRGVEND